MHHARIATVVAADAAAAAAAALVASAAVVPGVATPAVAAYNRATVGLRSPYAVARTVGNHGPNVASAAPDAAAAGVSDPPYGLSDEIGGEDADHRISTFQ
uniref:Secreted protein n=1 Tax=Anopheles darlingi TaxID=43151 RepID=A0A2M4D6U7_ANODA